MPLVQTRGAASAQGFGEFAQASAVNYIEDVFSCFVYAGSNSSQTITNGIDLSTNGGLVWTKVRTTTYNHCLTDTIRGGNKQLFSNTTDASTTSSPAEITSFNTTGYTLAGGTVENVASQNFVGWTFRKQAKFFDVVTWTGNGSGSRAISHALASTPGCIMIKRTDASDNWYVVHRSVSSFSAYGVLNSTAAFVGSGSGVSSVGSSTFTVSNYYNATSETWVAYLFAHDAGGFGLTGADNVISCGSYTGTGALQTITLGYEPQWLLVKRTDSATGGDWGMFDTMRQMSVANASGNANLLVANTTDAEALIVGFSPIATGFQTPAGNNFNLSGGTYIYIACRRGPMKVPTLGTSVFSTSISSATTGTITSGFVTDLAFTFDRSVGSSAPPYDRGVLDRLRGDFINLSTATTGADTTNSTTVSFQQNNGIKLNGGGVYANGYVYEQFQRAPGFFDEVCYTGTGSNTTQTHNLGVVPELIIVKRRETTGAWDSYSSALANTEYVVVNTTAAKATGATRWNSTTPTSSVFSVGTSTTTNASAGTYVAYLFATCAGVSKVGSYSGNTGVTVVVPCGFTSGVRFVLIKRTDSTGDWYVWDSARGIIAGNDPYLLLNDTAAEVTSTDYVDTYSAGFEVTSTAPAGLNATGGTYIFLAIA